MLIIYPTTKQVQLFYKRTNLRMISMQGKTSKIHRLTKFRMQREKGHILQEGCQVSNFLPNWPCISKTCISNQNLFSSKKFPFDTFFPWCLDRLSARNKFLLSLTLKVFGCTASRYNRIPRTDSRRLTLTEEGGKKKNKTTKQANKEEKKKKLKKSTYTISEHSYRYHQIDKNNYLRSSAV